MNPTTWVPPGSSVPDEPRWHYRRSLASRVILMTTMAVCFAVALVSLARSYRADVDADFAGRLVARPPPGDPERDAARAHQCEHPELAGRRGRRPHLLRLARQPHHRLGPAFQIGAPELSVASGHSQQSVRTISSGAIDYGWSPSGGPRHALVLAQNIAPQESVLQKMGAVMLLFGLAGVIVAAAVSWAVARNGPARPPPHPQRRGDRPYRGPHATPGRGRRRDRPPASVQRCWPHCRLPATGAAAGR